MALWVICKLVCQGVCFQIFHLKELSASSVTSAGSVLYHLARKDAFFVF